MEWRGWKGRAGQGRAGQGRVPDCFGGLSRVGISSRSTRPWNGQPPSITTILVMSTNTSNANTSYNGVKGMTKKGVTRDCLNIGAVYKIPQSFHTV